MIWTHFSYKSDFFQFVMILIFRYTVHSTDSKSPHPPKTKCENSWAEWRQIKTVWGTNLGLVDCLANRKRTAGRLEQIFYLSLFHFQTARLHSKHRAFDCPHNTGRWNLWSAVPGSHTFSTFEPQSFALSVQPIVSARRIRDFRWAGRDRGGGQQWRW